MQDRTVVKKSILNFKKHVFLQLKEIFSNWGKSELENDKPF